MHAIVPSIKTDSSLQQTRPKPSPWLLRSLFDNCPSATAVLDESGIILHTNEAWSLAGQKGFFGPQYEIGASYVDLCEGERGESKPDALALANGIHRVINRKQENFILTYTTSEQSFTVHVTGLRLPGSAINILVSHQCFESVKLPLPAFLPEKNPFSEAFHFVQQPMSLTTVAHGRYIEVNESFLTLLGYQRNSVIGHTSLELGIWASPDEREQFISQLKANGRIENIETHLRDKSGRPHVWLSSAQIIQSETADCVLVASIDITERKRVEREIREVSGRLIRVQEEERSRIARELHDDINQKLVLLSIELEQLSESPLQQPGEIRKQSKALWKRAQELSADIHRISYNLHPSKLDHLGLVAAIRSLCHEVSAHHGLEIELIAADIFGDIPRDVALCLFRVVQEALRNVIRHSGCRTARVELRRRGEDLNLRITDSGSGFEPTSVKTRLGLGIVSMTERLRLIGGELVIRSKPSRGTQVEARVSKKFLAAIS